jgi:outer membrane protein OmpA-like peptidoglycan-associated protein
MQRIIFIAFGLSLTAFVGCGGPNSQLTACQQDKEQLLTTIRNQRDTTRALRDQVASLETRLDQSEKQLARGSGTRLSSAPADSPPIVKSESLPWRSPPGKASASETSTRTARSRPRAGSESLAALADDDRRLHYDAQSRAARLDLPIAFEGTTANLSAEGKKQLDEVARLLKSDAARDKRIMVAGHAGRPSTTTPTPEGQERHTLSRQVAAARAQAVADFLDRHGVAGERLAVTGVGAPLGDKAASDSGVQIYLLEPDATVVGWEPGPALRR